MKTKPTTNRLNRKSATIPPWSGLWGEPWKHLGVSLVLLGAIGACSSVPDYANPAEWYRGVVDSVSSEDEAEQEAAVEMAVPGEDDEFPALGSVPERPATGDSGMVADSLIADPDAPGYAPAIALQSNQDSENLQPAPPPQPVIAVEMESAEISAGSDTGSDDAMTEVIMVDEQDTGDSVQATETSVDSTSSPLVIEPGRLPSGETYDQYRARLMSGLEQPGISSPTANLTGQSGVQDFSFDLSSGTSSTDTVTISSGGVQHNSQVSNIAPVSPVSSGQDVMDTQGMMSESGFLQIDNAGGQPLVTPGSVKIATILFGNGSSGLGLPDRRILQKVAALQQKQGGVIRIIGHASSRTRTMDPVKHKLVNYRVSVARADHIARELVRLGAIKSQIVIGAVSDTEPLYYEVMPTGEAGNRRAEIFIDS